MSKLWNYFTGKKAPEPPSTPLVPRPSEHTVDFRSPVQIRKKTDKVPNFRHPFTTETDTEHYHLFSLFHHFPELKVVWEGITKDFIENRSLLKGTQDNICHHRLHERVWLFGELYAGLEELSNISNLVPYSLVHLLLVTLQDVTNLSKASTVWQYSDPFQLQDCQEELRKLSKELMPLLGLTEYFIYMDESCLLLSKEVVGLLGEYVKFLGEKLGVLAGRRDNLAEDFVKLYYYAVHCLFALGKLHKSHISVYEDSRLLLELVLIALREECRHCYQSEALKQLTQINYPFLREKEPHMFARFSIGDRDKYDLSLSLLKYQTKLAKGVEGLPALLLAVFTEIVLHQTVLSLSQSEGEIPQQHRSFEEGLIVLELLLSLAKTAPLEAQGALQTCERLIQSLVRAVSWCSFSWTLTSPSSTYRTKSTILERLYCQIDQISLAALMNTEAEALPIAFFEQLLTEDMEERAKDHVPLPQVYTLELISCCIAAFSASDESYERLLNSPLLRILFSPLFFVIQEETDSHFQARLSQMAAAYMNDILKVVLSRPEGKKLVIQHTIQSIHMHKLYPAYLNQVTSLLFFLVSERDSLISHYFAEYKIADNVYQIIQDLRQDRQSNRLSLGTLEIMLIKILEMPQISAGVLTNEAFLNKFMNEQLFSAETSEFCIQCVSNLMRLSNSEYLYRLFVLTLKQVKDESMFKWLIQGVERTIKGTDHREACQKEFMDADLLSVLIEKLNANGSLSMCSLVLPTLRVVLEGNALCKSQFSRMGLGRLQQVLNRVLTHDQMQALELVLDNLLYILFESDDFSKGHRILQYPQIAPLILDLLRHFPEVRVPRFYISIFAQIAEESTENRLILAKYGCIRPLLELLSAIADATFRTDVLNLITVMCQQYLAPLDLRTLISWVARDAASGVLSKEGKSLMGALAASCRDALEPLMDQKRPLPRSYFSFTGQESPIQVSGVRGNLLMVPGKGFTVAVWIRPLINPETMFSNVFTFAEKNSAILLNVTASGALQLMISAGEKQLVEVVTEQEKLLFNRWNFLVLVCSQKYSKKDEFVLYLNGSVAEQGEIRPGKLPKEMYSTVWLGGNQSGDTFTGQISTLYLFATAAGEHHVTAMYRLGPDYEGLMQAEEIASARVYTVDRLGELKNALSLCISPRYFNLKGKIKDASPTVLTAYESQEAGRTKRAAASRRPDRNFEHSSVLKIAAVRTPDTLNLFGGPSVLFPLLYRLKDKSQVMELLLDFFYLISDLFLIPSHLTVKAICKDGLCELIRMVLEDLAVKQEVDPGLVRCVVRMVENLDWNRDARHRAFCTLLHSFRFWSRLDWDLQKDLLMHVYRLLPSVRIESDPTTLSSALSLLSTYFSTARPVVDKDQLQVKRDYLWTIVRTYIHKTGVIDDQDMGTIIENALFTYSSSRVDLPDLIRLIRLIATTASLKITEETKEEYHKAIMYLTLKSGQKGLTDLQADTINALRLSYPATLITQTSALQKQLQRVINYSSSDNSVFRFKSAADIFEVLDCMLPKVLTLPVYTALLQILVEKERPDMSLAAIKHQAVLDLITTRINGSVCAGQIYQDLRLLADQHIELMYKRPVFPAWLLHLFIFSDHQDPDPAHTDYLFSLCKTLFTKAFLQLKNSGMQLRAFIFTFVARKAEEHWSVVYRILGDLMDGLELGIAAGHAANIRKEIYYNFHDFAYMLEDLCEAKPDFPDNPHFSAVISMFVRLCKQLKLCMSSYPPFPALPTIHTSNILSAALQFSSEVPDTVRLREGGMLRALLSLILTGLAHSRTDSQTGLMQDLNFLLNGGADQASLSAFSAANKNFCQTILQDESGFSYLAVFGEIPLEAASKDLIYSEEFLVLWVLTYCSEAIYDKGEKGLDCSLLLSAIRDLVRKFKLGQHLNAVLSRETPESMAEIKEFHSRHSTLFPSLMSLQSHVQAAFSKLEAFLGVHEDDDIELKNLQQQVKRLSLELNKAANGGLDGILVIIASEEWRERVHNYLVVQTAARLLTITKATSRFLPAAEVHFELLEPSQDYRKRIVDDLRKWKKAVVQRVHQREKTRDRGETLERLYTRRRWRKQLKLLTARKAGIWTIDSQTLFETGCTKLVSRFDRENRHFLLQPDSTGSSHLEAINRKHLKEFDTASSKRRTITSIDPEDPAQREMLRSFPSLPLDSEESQEREKEIETESEASVAQERTQSDAVEGEEVKTEIDEIPEQETVEDLSLYAYPKAQDTSLIFECERICLKGAVFGRLEVTQRFLVFKSTKEMKPPGVYFGSALSCSQVAIESELIWDIREIAEVFSRRFHHIHTAVEVFQTTGKGYYFNCFSEARRTELLTHFRRFPKVKVYFDPKKEFRQGTYTKDWQTGRLSNSEYLTLLNKFAGRSYNDLNQYPIFPWILKDYQSDFLNLSNPDVYRDLSIPIGAIHPDGLRECTRRYALWTEDPIMKPFHFGSHYSSEGIVLHYMLRVEPYASKAILLQDGTFDVADRLFFSIYSAYEGSTRSSGDVKELIPEFFYLPEMFCNGNNYELGRRQTGEQVANVELPRWARNPYDFIRLHKKALESLLVSENLNNWIDLVFGYKQWGEAAVAANNVFFCFTYEQHVVPLLKSTVDTASMEGVIEQIGQFGQTPVQLFDQKHDKRLTSPVATTFFDRLQRRLEGAAEVAPYGPVVDAENDTTVIAVFALRSRLLIVQDNLCLKICKWRQGTAENNRPEPSRSQENEQLLENAFPYIGDFPRSAAAYVLAWPHLISGLHWDNSFKVHEFESGKLYASITHHSDLVTCLAYTGGVLVSGSLDSTLAVWDVRSSKTQKILIDPYPHLSLLGHCAGIKQCCVSAALRLVVSLGLDGGVLVHSLNDGLAMLRLDASVEFTPYLVALSCFGLIASCSRDNERIRIHSCNGQLLDTSAQHSDFSKARQLFFSTAGEHLLVMCANSISILNTYALEEHIEIALEQPPAAVTMTMDDQNVVGVNRMGHYFRVDAECKRTKVDFRNIYDTQGIGKAFGLDS